MRFPSLVLLALFLVSLGTANAADPAAEGKYRVLILGDSISIGYTPYVQKLLAKEAVVLRPTSGKRAENCAGTNNGIQHIDRWLKIDGGKFDVIHVNFGLHDLKHVKAGGANSNDSSDPHQASPEQYAKQLQEIVVKLKASGATVIIATTTPVPEGKVSPFRDPEDVERYNAIAKRIAKDHDLAVNDLYGFALERLEKIQRPVNVHFTAEGSQALAKQVVEAIKQARLPIDGSD